MPVSVSAVALLWRSASFWQWKFSLHLGILLLSPNSERKKIGFISDSHDIRPLNVF